MNNIYLLGWDVGTWKCSGASLDALHLFQIENGQPVTIGEPFCGNLWRVLNGNCQIDSLLNLVKCPELGETDKLILSIDAVFGWPAGFLELLSNGIAAPTPDVTARNTDNRYLYRDTERFIIEALNLKSPNLPKTAVGDQLGTAATKVQHFLASLENRESCYVPPLDRWDVTRARQSRVTVIEAYPGATKFSKRFGEVRMENGVFLNSMGKTDPEDALRCAMVAACYAKTVNLIDSDRLPPVYLPSDCSSTYLGVEGWIFTPKV